MIAAACSNRARGRPSRVAGTRVPPNLPWWPHAPRHLPQSARSPPLGAGTWRTATGEATRRRALPATGWRPPALRCMSSGGPPATRGTSSQPLSAIRAEGGMTDAEALAAAWRDMLPAHGPDRNSAPDELGADETAPRASPIAPGPGGNPCAERMAGICRIRSATSARGQREHPAARGGRIAGPDGVAPPDPAPRASTD